MKLNWNFLGGGGGAKQKNLLWGGNGYFLVQLQNVLIMYKLSEISKSQIFHLTVYNWKVQTIFHIRPELEHKRCETTKEWNKTATEEETDSYLFC